MLLKKNTCHFLYKIVKKLKTKILIKLFSKLKNEYKNLSNCPNFKII